MPIAFVSVDSKNETLNDFKSVVGHIDLILESEDPRCRAISDMFEGMFTQRLALDKLNDGTDAIGFQAALNMIRKLDIQTAMIISHHSVFNGWKQDAVNDEWSFVEM